MPNNEPKGDELDEKHKQLIQATIKEFMNQIYAGFGKSILEKLFWLGVGAALSWWFGSHLIIGSSK